MILDQRDAEFLLARPEFRRFLYAVIQMSGLFGDMGAADGRTARDLSLEWLEGRRSLGREILLMADEGQPEALRCPNGQPLVTIHAVLAEAINPKEKPNARRSRPDDRYDDDGTDFGDDDD